MNPTAKQEIYLRIITTTLLIIGGINWGIIGTTGINPISRILRFVNAGFMSKCIYTMIGIAALLYLYFFYNRNTFLPFLSEASFPISVINKVQSNNYNHEVTLNSPPKGAKMVVYWAAEPYPNSNTYNPTSPLASQNIEPRVPEIYKTPEDAYDNYENAGSTKVENGKAIIRLKKPPAYRLPNGKVNHSHVHYRWVLGNGMLSDVATLYL